MLAQEPTIQRKDCKQAIEPQSLAHDQKYTLSRFKVSPTRGARPDYVDQYIDTDHLVSDSWQPCRTSFSSQT
jgi:hypothetical protein